MECPRSSISDQKIERCHERKVDAAKVLNFEIIGAWFSALARIIGRYHSSVSLEKFPESFMVHKYFYFKVRRSFYSHCLSQHSPKARAQCLRFDLDNVAFINIPKWASVGNRESYNAHKGKSIMVKAKYFGSRTARCPQHAFHWYLLITAVNQFFMNSSLCSSTNVISWDFTRPL